MTLERYIELCFGNYNPNNLAEQAAKETVALLDITDSAERKQQIAHIKERNLRALRRGSETPSVSAYIERFEPNHLHC